jgi:hypothetical protein
VEDFCRSNVRSKSAPLNSISINAVKPKRGFVIDSGGIGMGAKIDGMKDKP